MGLYTDVGDLPYQIASWVCVSMRLWVRFKVVRAPGWDDFFVVLYLVSVIILLMHRAGR